MEWDSDVKCSEQLKLRELRAACIEGNLTIVKRLTKFHNLTAAQVEESGALYSSAAAGHLDLVQWLKDTFNIPRLQMHALDHYMVRTVWKKSYLAIVRWWKSVVDLEGAKCFKDTLGPEAGLVLRDACYHGHLDMAQWILATFSPEYLSTVDMRAAMQRACSNGHLEIAKWLKTTSGTGCSNLVTTSTLY